MTKRHSGNFSITPATAIFDQQLCHADVRVLSALGTYADKEGRCWPAVPTIARRIGMSERHARTSIRNLENLGYLETEARPGLSSMYQIPRNCTAGVWADPGTVLPGGRNCTAGDPGTVVPPNNTKNSTKNESANDSSLSSTQQFTGGQKEDDTLRNGSSEDLFWSLTGKAAAVSITRGLMGKLATVMGDFDKAYPALLGALDKAKPPAYVAKIIKNEQQEQGARGAAAGVGNGGEPGFVLEAYRAGQAVEQLPEGTWRIAGTIYDAAGEEVGW